MKRPILLLVSAVLAASATLAWEGARCSKPLDTCLSEKRAVLEKRGVLGFLWSPVGEGEPVPPNARYVVRSVPRGYPAEAAGLREHDVLLALNGKDLSAMPRHQLESALQRVTVGEKVSFRVWREGRTLDLSFRAAKPAPESIEAWLGQHVRDEHPESDFREYLRRSRKAPG